MKFTVLPRTTAHLAGALLLAAGLAMSIGCTQLSTIGPDDCTMGEVETTGTAARHQERYTFECAEGVVGQVSAAHDAATHRGEEKPSNATAAVTAEPLFNIQRHVLDAQVQNALKVLAPAPLPAAAERLRDRLDSATTARTQLLPPPTPADFRGERDASRIVLRWTDTSNETYYSLTASNARSGQTFTLPAPAPKLGANSTMYIDDVLGPTQAGGAEYHLQACNIIGCSDPARVVVP